MRKAIFFDRDGILNKSIVINAKPYSPRSLKEFKINLFLRKYINFFKKKNFMIIVITNQPDVGAGKVPKNLILYFHKVLKKKLLIDDIFVCYDLSNKSFLKKPNPGMLYVAQKKYKIDMSKSYFIGDRWKDMKASYTAGVKGLFVDFQYNEKPATKYHKKFNSLYNAVIFLKKEIQQNM